MGFVSDKERYTTVLDKAPVINGKEEWFYSLCETSIVWSKDPNVLLRDSQQALEELQYVHRQYRIAAARDRKQKEMEEQVGKLEARLKAANSQLRCTHGRKRS